MGAEANIATKLPVSQNDAVGGSDHGGGVDNRAAAGEALAAWERNVNLFDMKH